MYQIEGAGPYKIVVTYVAGETPASETFTDVSDYGHKDGKFWMKHTNGTKVTVINDERIKKYDVENDTVPPP